MIVRRRVARALALLAAWPVLARAHAGHEETAWGKPGDPKRAARVVPIVMQEREGRMVFIPDSVRVRTGEQIRFVLRNAGVLDHEFVLATTEENRRHAIEMEQHPHMDHDEPNAKRLKPRGTGEILWHFTKPGRFEFACLIPGHLAAGMVGTVTVE